MLAFPRRLGAMMCDDKGVELSIIDIIPEADICCAERRRSVLSLFLRV